MFRLCLIVISGTIVALAAWAASLDHAHQAWAAFAWASIVLLALIFERTLYKPELTAPPGPDWIATQELEVDDAGAIRVWCHPKTGERAYVRESARYS